MKSPGEMVTPAHSVGWPLEPGPFLAPARGVVPRHQTLRGISASSSLSRTSPSVTIATKPAWTSAAATSPPMHEDCDSPAPPMTRMSPSVGPSFVARRRKRLSSALTVAVLTGPATC